MVGDVYFYSGKAYVVVNKTGTMEKLPPLRWHQTIVVYFMSQLGLWDLYKIRSYCELCK